jgi:hypothetical protein
MASRAPEFGIDVALKRKMAEKYTPETEAEVLGWLSATTGVQIAPGMQSVHEALKDGRVLIQHMNKLLEGTTRVPPEMAKLKVPIKINTMQAPFKQMENIEQFVKAAEAYGVPKASTFQTVDLYESRNMAQVLLCLVQLGTEAQRNGFNGPTIGPKPAAENRRNFSDEQMHSGDNVIGLQMGSNKGASQAGMSFGTQRHINDIKCDAPSNDPKGSMSMRM